MNEEFTEKDREHWEQRGREDAERDRNALMWPTSSGGVFFDIEPPTSWTPEFSRAAATAYYNAFMSWGA